MARLILEESMRKLTENEIILIEKLIENINSFELVDDLKTVNVELMQDGGMGSLMFENNHQTKSPLTKLNEFFFSDSDGVKVVATLFIDRNRKLAELDIWKTDFSPLLKIPNLR